jgi:hypothetical protein
MQDYESARLLISYGLRETAKWAAPPASVAAATAAAAALAPEFATPGRVLRPSSSSSGATPGRGAGAVPLPSPGGLTGLAAAAGVCGAALWGSALPLSPHCKLRCGSSGWSLSS